MNCEQMTELISAWLDGETTAQEEQQLFEHLEQCAQCRALLEQLQTLHTSFSDLEEIPAPAGFADRVMDKVRAERKPKVVPLFRRPQFRAVAGLAACAALCIGLMQGGFSNRKSAESAAPAAAAPEAYQMEPCEAVPEAEGADALYSKAADVAAPEAPAETPNTAPATPESTTEEPGMAAPEFREDSDNLSGRPVGSEKAGLPSIELTALPEGMDALGELDWQVRESDGAICAHLNADQAETLLKLIDDQGLTAQTSAPGAGQGESWLLVLLPN